MKPVSFAPHEYTSRACCRSFAVDPVPLRSLSRLLGLLKQETVNGEPKYLYPSAGGLNAVQTYVYAKEGRVEGLSAGIYYYHPVSHQLHSSRAGRDHSRRRYASCRPAGV